MGDEVRDGPHVGTATDVGAVTESRELVHGDQGAFIAGYSWQHGGSAVGDPGHNVGGGGR